MNTASQNTALSGVVNGPATCLLISEEPSGSRVMIGVAIVVKIWFWNGAMTAKTPSSDRMALNKRERSS